MTKMKVIKDKDGNIINIGDWNYLIEEEEYTEIEERTISVDTGFLDSNGAPLLKSVTEQIEVTKSRTVQRNPLPEGATEEIEDIVVGYDGGLYHVDNPNKDGK